ncbi:MAG: SpoIIE family protein phosphatase [Christensenellaceae bacterium]|jgi:stage II sporulation protein E|nr:SpoIIE family protein phosphatase [Christensenellaceae bacterium]
MRRIETLKFFVFFLFFLLLFFLESKILISPFAIAFYMALIYSKQNVILLSTLYVVASLIINFSFVSFLISITPCAVILLAYFVHYYTKKKISLFFIHIYLFVSQIPVMIVGANDIPAIIYTAISVIIAQVFIYCVIIVLYATLIKHFSLKFTTEENISSVVILCVIGMCITSFKIAWFEIYFTILLITVVLFLFIDKKVIIPISVFFGLGSLIYSLDSTAFTISVLYGLTAFCFSKPTHRIAAMIIVVTDFLLRFILSADGTISMFKMLAPAIGAIIVILIPNKIKNSLSIFETCFKDRKASRSLINRDRHVMAEKISTLSSVFCEIGDILQIDNSTLKDHADVANITKEVCLRCCATCPGLSNCRDTLNGADTDIIVTGLVAGALNTNRATILDTPQMLSSRCRKINAIISVTNEILKRYKSCEQSRTEFNESREMISVQMKGVGSILGTLRLDIGKLLSFDTVKENRLIEELIANNIYASEAIIYGMDKNDYSVIIVVRESDSRKSNLPDLISMILGTKMAVCKIEKTINEMTSVYLEKATRFQVVYGNKERAKSVDGFIGDRHRAIRIAHNKIMLILSDGMGSGINAGKNASYAINLIESFYRVGFDHATIATTVSRLLSIRNTEEFNAIDVILIDTSDGSADFIKMGGRESFIVDQGVVEVVECGSLPVGIIVDGAVPLVEKRILNSGNFIIMVSDGVIDALGRDAIVDRLSELRTGNPDAVANLIISDYDRIVESNASEPDDASVIVAKIFSQPETTQINTST